VKKLRTIFLKMVGDLFSQRLYTIPENVLFFLGFAALATMDAGWYGQGIYVTTSAVYALPYYAEKQSPVMIISYVLPGNVYPVIEVPQSENSLAGYPLQAGYSSHYILTDLEGLPHSKQKNEPLYDELVIAQEGQITPAFLVKIDPTRVQSAYSTFLNQQKIQSVRKTQVAEREELKHAKGISLTVIPNLLLENDEEDNAALQVQSLKQDDNESKNEQDKSQDQILKVQSMLSKGKSADKHRSSRIVADQDLELRNLTIID